MSYKVGDKVWWVAHSSRLIAILCEIIDVQRWGNINSHYWIDEPSGYAVDSDELFETRDEVEDVLFDLWEKEGKPQGQDITLGEFRLGAIVDIMSTWKEDMRRRGWRVKYRDKKEKEEWFNIGHYDPSWSWPKPEEDNDM